MRQVYYNLASKTTKSPATCRDPGPTTVPPSVPASVQSPVGGSNLDTNTFLVDLHKFTRPKPPLTGSAKPGKPPKFISGHLW